MLRVRSVSLLGRIHPCCVVWVMEAEGKVILVTNAKQRFCELSWFGSTYTFYLMPGMYIYIFYRYSINIFVLAFVSRCGFFYIFSMDKWTGKMSLRSLKQSVLILEEFLSSALVKKKVFIIFLSYENFKWNCLTDKLHWVKGS